jgi:hypothetical protein
MSRFNEIVKHLDLVPARKPTVGEAMVAPNPFDRYYSLVEARTIEKLHPSISIPAITLPNTVLGLQAQFNFSLPYNFILLPPHGYLAGLNNTYFLCVKYREDSTVVRKILTWQLTWEYWWTLMSGLGADVPYLRRGVGGDFYQNEVIKKNFCIEYWSTAYQVGGPIDAEAVSFEISIRENPVTGEETAGTVYGGTLVTRAELVKTLPIALPVTFNTPESEWLTNT